MQSSCISALFPVKLNPQKVKLFHAHFLHLWSLILQFPKCREYWKYLLLVPFIPEVQSPKLDPACNRHVSSERELTQVCIQTFPANQLVINYSSNQAGFKISFMNLTGKYLHFFHIKFQVRSRWCGILELVRTAGSRMKTAPKLPVPV